MRPTGAAFRAAQELRELQAQWRRALSARDTAFFQKVIADDFVITGNATTETKTGFIRELAASTAAVPPAHLEETNIRVFGDFAVLTGLIRYDIPGSAEPVRSRYTDVWVKRGGRWLSLHSHHNPLTTP